MTSSSELHQSLVEGHTANIAFSIFSPRRCHSPTFTRYPHNVAEVRLQRLSFSLPHSPTKKAYFSPSAFTLPSLPAILIYIRLSSGIEVLFFPQALTLGMSPHHLSSNTTHFTYLMVLWYSSLEKPSHYFSSNAMHITHGAMVHELSEHI